MTISVNYYHWDDSGKNPKIVDFRTIVLTDEDILGIVREKMEQGELPFPMHLNAEELRFECTIDKVVVD
jgi:hypothetical protein